MKHLSFSVKMTRISTIALILTGLIFGSAALAQQKETIPDMEVKNDFVLSGGKIEVEMSAGEKADREITITSRLGREMTFHIGTEDFRGSNSPDDPAAVLLGDERGPYSLKDYIHPAITEFNLNHGERIRIPFTIDIPENAAPGGLYGSLVVWASNPEKQGEVKNESAEGQVKVISRLASLIFVKVKGDAKEDGSLLDFKTTNRFYEKGPVKFEVSYENKGNIYLNPYGMIEITNLMGRKVGAIEIAPFFVLPQSKRWQYYSWDRAPLFGLYTAKLSLNRGYDNIVDEKEIKFWVVPWKFIIIVLLGLVFITWLLIRFFRGYEIKKKG